MIDARFVPIEQWPGEPTPSYKQRDGTFRATYGATLDLLETELRHLRAKNILIQAYFTLDQIRNDGWPKASARPTGDGVIVTFETPKGPLSFPCDRFKTYDDNLRAIALSLQALRAVDRYGVTRRAEQYQGWAKLPPAPAKMSRSDAVVFLALHSGMPDPATDVQRAYRAAAAKLHPDNTQTGNTHLFHLLNQAREALQEE